MKKHLLFLLTIIIVSTTGFAQVFDSIAMISPDYEIEDLTSKGTTLFAALGLGGVWYSEDEGYTWTQTSALPDAGFGQEVLIVGRIEWRFNCWRQSALQQRPFKRSGFSLDG